MRRLPILAIALLVLGACHRAEPAAPRAKPAAAKSHAADDWESASLPSRDRYAGSAVCRDCHAKNYDAWSHDWHARALSEANRDTVVGDFRRAHFKGASSEAWMTAHGSRFAMRTRGATPDVRDFPVQYVIGGKRMQDDVTILPDGRWQVLPVYFHVTGHGAWVDYNEAKQGRVTPDHPFYWTNFQRMANKECLDCHATGVELHYERASHQWRTTFADAGVACEACHGPGARHAETKQKADIVQPAHLGKEPSLAVCGRCHGPREPLFPAMDVKHEFRPGESYDAKFQALVIVDANERSGEFFADGRPSSSSFEYQALLQSRCWMNGGATCLSCHTAPHAEHAANEMERGNVCAGCHARESADPRAHSRHAKATCVDCHMPPVVTGVLDAFPDHTLDVPNPRNTAVHGVPNACNVCHKDKTPAAMQTAMLQWWPDVSTRQLRRARLADAIDEKTSASSFDALVATIRDKFEAPTLRGAAAALLAQRFPQRAPSVLQPLLHDRSPVVRAKFAEALGYTRGAASADAVASLLGDFSPAVREMAALVLISLGDSRGVDACQRLVSDPATSALVRPHIALAIDAANHGQLAAAEQQLQFATGEVPYLTDALVMLADIQARRGDMAHAREYLEEALRFDPRHRGATRRLAAMSAAPH